MMTLNSRMCIYLSKLTYLYIDMIYHCKDKLQDLSYTLKPPLKYSEDFTFIPIRIKNKEFIVQTPKVFVPFGIQQNDKSKDYVMISFQNKDNDKDTTKFLDDLQFIYELIKNHYHDKYQVNHFLKEYKGDQIMNLKMDSSPLIFDSRKQICEDLPIYSYASFIIHLVGLWISKDQVWFQWYTLQTRLENKVSLSIYAFKGSIPDPPIPPPPPPPPPPRAAQAPSLGYPSDKYKKMITMGIPSAAVNQQKQIDAKSSINSDMLLSVRLKKTSKKDIIKSDMNGFEPPSLGSLQHALQNLRNIISDK